jgi:hypothetical protein
LQLTPLCVEQDRRDFETRFRSTAVPFMKAAQLKRIALARPI